MGPGLERGDRRGPWGERVGPGAGTGGDPGVGEQGLGGTGGDPRVYCCLTLLPFSMQLA